MIKSAFGDEAAAWREDELDKLNSIMLLASSLPFHLSAGLEKVVERRRAAVPHSGMQGPPPISPHPHQK